MNNRRAFRWWQAKWLLKGVLRGHCGPRTAIRAYRNTRCIPAFTVGNPPPPGDVAWTQLNDHDVQILGRHVRPEPDGEVQL